MKDNGTSMAPTDTEKTTMIRVLYLAKVIITTAGKLVEACIMTVTAKNSTKVNGTKVTTECPRTDAADT